MFPAQRFKTRYVLDKMNNKNWYLLKGKIEKSRKLVSSITAASQKFSDTLSKISIHLPRRGFVSPKKSRDYATVFRLWIANRHGMCYSQIKLYTVGSKLLCSIRISKL